jgi:hypothetical protein
MRVFGWGLVVSNDGVFAFGGGIVLVVPTAVGVSFLIGLLVFPLCGGHLLFFAGRKEK